MSLPKPLQDHLNVRGYYGTVRHNVRAVYQFYLGWFDAHPANLDALPPVDAGKRYVALAGGADKVVAAAQQAFDAGEFRWAAELLKHAVYADPQNRAASELMARCFEQMGYMAESAPWRNVYLTGALELRQGPPDKGIPSSALLDMLQHTPIERFLDAMAANLNGPKAADASLKINLVFSDLGESYVLHIAPRRAAPPPSAAGRRCPRHAAADQTLLPADADWRRRRQGPAAVRPDEDPGQPHRPGPLLRAAGQGAGQLPDRHALKACNG